SHVIAFMGGNSQFDVGIAYETPVIPAKAGIQSFDGAFRRGCGVDSSRRAGFLEMRLGRLVILSSVILSSVILLLGGSTRLQASDDCLSCHGPSTGLTNSQGKPITVKAEALAHSVHKDLR